jgi:transposase
VVADKAYSSPSTRAVREHGIPVTRPGRVDQIQRRRAKGSRGGRLPAFDQVIYAGRNVVERCFNRLKQFRGLATRYAKRAAYYRAEIIVAAIVVWLRSELQDTAWPPDPPARPTDRLRSEPLEPPVESEVLVSCARSADDPVRDT